MRLILTLLGVVPFLCAAQDTIPKIHTGQYFESGLELKSEEKYEEALSKFIQIPENDSLFERAQFQAAAVYYNLDKHDSTIAIAKRHIAKNSYNKIDFYSLMGTALTDTSRSEEARKVLREAIDEFPYYAQLYYRMAMDYYQQKEYKESLVWFEKALELDPFHAASHYFLAFTALQQEQVTHALLGFTTYLLIVPNGDTPAATLALMETISDGEYESERIQPVHPNDFAVIDQLITSKVALNKKYKIPVKIDASIVRQLALIMEKAEFTEKSDDLYMRIYGPLFENIRQEKLTPALLYAILLPQKDRISEVAKWQSSNEKSLTALYGTASATLRDMRDAKTFTAGPSNEQLPPYYEKGLLRAIGKIDNGIQTGYWQIFSDQQHVIAEGVFNKEGKKTGEWKYYSPSGVLSKIESYDNNGQLSGPVTLYHPGGGVRTKTTFTNNEIQGDFTTYYACGGVDEKYVYSAGKRDGKYAEHYFWGPVKVTYTYVADKPEGEVTFYHSNGQLSEKFTFTKGNREGEYKAWYDNGQLKSAYAYKGGNVDGPYKSYYPSGKLEEEGLLADGKRSGEWKLYDKYGRLVTTKLYDSGDITEEKDFHRNGKLYSQYNYTKGRVNYLSYRDSTGKLLSEEKLSRNTVVKGYHENGELMVQGEYAGGKFNGAWRWFDMYGSLETEKFFKDGTEHGTRTNFYPEGTVKNRTEYVDGVNHGYYRSYYRDGSLKSEGWVHDGNETGQWKSYYPDGKVEQVYHYAAGKMNGPSSEFGPDGKLVRYVLFDQGDVESETYYAADGRTLTSNEMRNEASYTQTTLHANGKNRSIANAECGTFHGPVTWYNTAGAKVQEFALENGSRHGKYTVWHDNGKVAVNGNYHHGQQHGVWEYFNEDGKLNHSGNFEYGDREGVFKWFHDNGKLSYTATYMDGKKEGWAGRYAPDGSPMGEIFYNEGEIIGTRSPTTTGGMTDIVYLENGTGIIKTFYANGKTAVEGTYKKGDLDGKYILYYPDGKVMEEEFYKAGNLEGVRKFYHPNGKVAEEENYRLGDKLGMQTYYTSTGAKEKQQSYYFDTLDGETILYDTAGKEKQKINYWNGYAQ